MIKLAQVNDQSLTNMSLRNTHFLTIPSIYIIAIDDRSILVFLLTTSTVESLSVTKENDLIHPEIRLLRSPIPCRNT